MWLCSNVPCIYEHNHIEYYWIQLLYVCSQCVYTTSQSFAKFPLKTTLRNMAKHLTRYIKYWMKHDSTISNIKTWSYHCNHTNGDKPQCMLWWCNMDETMLNLVCLRFVYYKLRIKPFANSQTQKSLKIHLEVWAWIVNTSHVQNICGEHKVPLWLNTKPRFKKLPPCFVIKMESQSNKSTSKNWDWDGWFD
jgi:hypothetical protein